MKFAVLLIFLVLPLATPLRAQQQERKLMDRLTSPDRSLTFHPEKTQFYGGKQYQSGNASSFLKTFWFMNLFSTKQFATKEFSAKSYWTGSFLDTKAAASTGKYNVPNLDQMVDVKAVPVHDSQYASKSYGTKAFQTWSSDMHGKIQGTLDAQQHASAMSIDQVRDLLNTKK